MLQTLSHQRRSAWPTNCNPNDAHVSFFFFFSILPVLYTQSTFAPFSNFEIGHFVCHFLFLSFGVVMKGIQFTQLRCHISFLLFTLFTTCFLSGRGRLLNSHKRWLFCLHIQHPLAVSLNDKPRLAHRRQQPAGSAFQFHYTFFRECSNLYAFADWLKNILSK